MIILLKILIIILAFKILIKSCRFSHITTIKEFKHFFEDQINELDRIIAINGEKTTDKLFKIIIISIIALSGLIGIFLIWAALFLI